MVDESQRPDHDRDDDRGEDRADRTLDRGEQERLAAARLDEIRQHFSDRYQRRDAVCQTTTPGGQLLDWVPIERQAEKIAEPPPAAGDDEPEYGRQPADARDARVRGDERVMFELERGAVERGPAGTVPLVRKRLDRITTHRSLQDFLSKHGRAARIQPDGARADVALPEDGTSHKYAYSAQWVRCFGCEGSINVWDPFVEWANEFSLGQCALTRGSGGGKQTIESGTQEYRDLYGDWVPHLFVFYTTNGYTSSGDNQGGYNQDVDGWVQYSSSIYPEALCAPVSTFDGTQYVLSLKWQLWEGNWWLRVKGEWIGYYPASLFSASGLRDEAEKNSWYGEVVDSGDHAGTTRTDMGNGHWPYEGWQRCAYMRNLRYQSSAGGAMSRYDPSSVYGSHPKCYNIEGHFDNTGSWASYFWWGGSGRNSQCP